MSRNQTVKVTIFVLVIAGLSATGAFLASGYGTNELGQSRQQRGLRVIQEQLADLKELLIDYRKQHDNYPTNDEGLAALDNFESRFKVLLRNYSGTPPDEAIMYALASRHFWQYSQQASLQAKAERGRFPKEPRDLSPVLDVFSPRYSSEDKAPPVEAELVIGKTGSVFLLGASGVLSPGLLPFMYENHSGIEPAKFAFSPVNGDTKRRYSVLVGEGVYVYSLDGQVCAETLDKLWWEDVGPVLIGLPFLAAALVAATVLFFAGRRKLALAALFVPALVGSIPGSIRSTCYSMVPLFSNRDPQMVVQQKDLLDKYRAAGVISEETYRRSLAAVEPVKAQAPSEGKK